MGSETPLGRGALFIGGRWGRLHAVAVVADWSDALPIINKETGTVIHPFWCEAHLLV